METADKTTISLVLEADNVADKLLSVGAFNEKMDAAKFGMAYYIKQNDDFTLDAKVGEGRGTAWNIGSFDKEGDLRALMQVLSPENKSPYRLLEILMNKGLILIGKHIGERNSFDISELI